MELWKNRSNQLAYCTHEQTSTAQHSTAHTSMTMQLRMDECKYYCVYSMFMLFSLVSTSVKFWQFPHAQFRAANAIVSRWIFYKPIHLRAWPLWMASLAFNWKPRINTKNGALCNVACDCWCAIAVHQNWMHTTNNNISMRSMSRCFPSVHRVHRQTILRYLTISHRNPNAGTRRMSRVEELWDRKWMPKCSSKCEFMHFYMQIYN